MENVFKEAIEEALDFLRSPNAYRSILILILAIVIAYIVSKYLARLIIWAAQKIAVRSDSMTDTVKMMQLRQVETYLSITVAIVRVMVVAVVAYVVWQLLSPSANTGVAAIGAGAIFVLIAGQTIGPLLRDITAGVVMIAERWFTIGDYVKIESFGDVSGVVERFTLRSTKIRSLSGEVIWVHNQNISGVHVTPGGLRTLVVDVFTRDVERAKPAIEEIIQSVPSSAALLSRPLRIKSVEQWGEAMWRISVIGRTAPGREWLVDKYFVNAVKEVDENATKKKDKVFMYEPIARYADPVAERKFKRAVRAKK